MSTDPPWSESNRSKAALAAYTSSSLTPFLAWCLTSKAGFLGASGALTACADCFLDITKIFFIRQLQQNDLKSAPQTHKKHLNFRKRLPAIVYGNARFACRRRTEGIRVWPLAGNLYCFMGVNTFLRPLQVVLLQSILTACLQAYLFLNLPIFPTPPSLPPPPALPQGDGYNLKMNSESDWERIVEWSHSETTYLLRVVVSPEELQLQLEDKFSGELWEACYSSAAIEELTEKARNRKKYGVFVNMLRSALERTKQNLFIEILSYREITIKTMKNGKANTSVPPEQASKRFLILNYHIDFEKIQFPISIRHFAEASPERLKLTIKRMAQEIGAFRSERNQSEVERENAYLKYELDSLKAKQKNVGKTEGSSVMQSRVEDLQREVAQKIAIIEKLNLKSTELQKAKQEVAQKLQQSEQKVQSLQQQLRQRAAVNQKTSVKASEQRLQQLISKMQKLGNELTFARQQQKKSQIKICTLQKQLQSMQKNQVRGTMRYKEDRLGKDSPPSRSEKDLSVKSGRSNKSGKSNTSKKNVSSIIKGMQTNNNVSYKKYSAKKISVYDSDTESSRMRRLNNGRSSPFRQGTVNANPKKNAKQRSRSKSRQKVVSPKPSNIVESQMYSQAFQSDDSEERFQRLQRQIGKTVKGKVDASRKTASRVSAATNQENIESKLQSLEDMIRKAAQSTKRHN